MTARLLITVLVAILGLTACGPKNDAPKSQSVQWIDPGKLHVGPIQHESLPAGMERRIAAFQTVFSDVDPAPLEKWIEDFKRDADPEREVRIWEAMARAYSKYTSGSQLPIEKRKELYGLLLAGSGAPPDDVLKHVKLKLFSEPEARAALALLAEVWNAK